jgi:hypothetical protein
MPARHYPPAEYQKCEGAALRPERLAAIWRTLLERERFAFVLSLEETIADRVIELIAAPAQSTGGKELTNGRDVGTDVPSPRVAF